MTTFLVIEPVEYKKLENQCVLMNSYAMFMSPDKREAAGCATLEWHALFVASAGLVQ